MSRTSTNAIGTEPIESQSTRPPCTVPRRRWTAAPTGLMITEATRSLGDRGRRRHAEYQDEDGGHEGAASHPGHSHHEADDEAGERNRDIHVNSAETALS